MWKKLRSSRDPRDTLFSELRKEFAPYLEAMCSTFIAIITRYPGWSFGIMITTLSCSTVLSFTCFRKPQKPPAVVTATPAADNGLSRIMGLTERIGETLKLKRAADSLNRKKVLTHADSVRLLRTLARLDQLIRH